MLLNPSAGKHETEDFLSRQDKYIFFGGAAFTFFCFYLILKYLG